MNDLLTGILIGLTVYSLILTIITLYKDYSNFYIIETIDIIMAGHIMWIVFLFLRVIHMVYTFFEKRNKNKKTVPKKMTSFKKNKIRRIVKRIIQIYKTKNNNDYFDFNMVYGDDYGCYSGWHDLLRMSPRYEFINRKFKNLMYEYKRETIAELISHCILVTEEVMIKDNCCSDYINDYRNRGLYKVI